MLNNFRYFKSIKVARLQINTLAQIPLNLPDSEGEDSKSDNAFEIIELLKAIGNGYNLPSFKPLLACLTFHKNPASINSVRT